jgi:hypothetical protein
MKPRPLPLLPLLRFHLALSQLLLPNDVLASFFFYYYYYYLVLVCVWFLFCFSCLFFLCLFASFPFFSVWLIGVILEIVVRGLALKPAGRVCRFGIVVDWFV